MFRKKHVDQPPGPPVAVRTGTLDVARDNEDPILPVLTLAEIIAVVNLLEHYIQLCPNDHTDDLAGTLIVRLLDRLPRFDDLDSPEPAH
jgi:hypothetical protein